MKILLVDDEIELVSAIAERLSIRNIDADWAVNAQEALKLAETKTYDMAVLDIKMPKIGGLKLKKLLHDKYPGMKFIFFTGHGSEEEYKVCDEDDVVDCLTKPFNIEVLIEKIQSSSSHAPSKKRSRNNKENRYGKWVQHNRLKRAWVFW
jgi:DNA-binding response OmpR family regulator